MKWFNQKSKQQTIRDKVIIRHLRKSDLPALEWNGEYTHFRQLYKDIFNSYIQGRAILWVAELPHSGIIGQMFVQLNSFRTEIADGVKRAYIFGFRIKPRYRCQGLGSLMLKTVEDDLRERGYDYVYLNVAQENLDARRLYERFGYQIVSEEPGDWSYIDHEGKRREVHEPSWRMSKKI